MYLKEKKKEKTNKLIEWGYTKLTNKTYCVYVSNYYNENILKKKIEEINNKKIIPRINLNIKNYLEFYIFNRDFREGNEEYSFSLCILDENEPNSDVVDIMSEYDFKRFVEMVDLINGTTTILKEEKEEVLDNLVIDNDIINNPNHYQLNIKGNNIEVIDIIDEVVKDYKPREAFKIANVIKYILRASKKNGKEDLKKARKYIEMLLETE